MYVVFHKESDVQTKNNEIGSPEANNKEIYVFVFAGLM